MIRKVSFSNFYSFNQKQEISFLAKKKTSYAYAKTTSNNYITKVGAFIGGNASGKTNIMRLFSFLSYFVCLSSKKDGSVPENDIAFKTFFDNKRPSEFYLECENKQNIFYYYLTIKNNIVLREELYFKKKKVRARKKNIFIRAKNDIRSFNKTLFRNFPIKFIKNIRLDVSLIAFLKSHYNIEIINEIYTYFANFKTNINESGQILHYFPPEQFKTLGMYLSDTNLKNEVEELLSNFDLGLSGFRIEKSEAIVPISGKHEITLSVFGKHQTANGNKELKFTYESSGTKSLFFTLGNILTALRNDSVIIIDEFEFGLHPEALNQLLYYFIDKNKNHRAQILFSSNCHDFMRRLDMHQIYLVEKNDVGESRVFRLNEVEGVRSDENFLNKYRSGAYGGFPKIRI